MKRRTARKTKCEAEGCQDHATRFVVDTSFGFCPEHAKFYEHDFKLRYNLVYEERMGRHLFKILDNGSEYVISVNGRLEAKTTKDFSATKYANQYRKILRTVK